MYIPVARLGRASAFGLYPVRIAIMRSKSQGGLPGGIRNPFFNCERSLSLYWSCKLRSVSPPKKKKKNTRNIVLADEASEI